MNRDTHTIDEPKLTAYALGELGAQERAAIERRLAEDPKARQQVEETIAFAVRLGSALRAEEAPELHAEHLRAIREAARKQRKVIAFPVWLTRAAVPLAAAAGVVLAGWFAIPAFRGTQPTPEGQVAQAGGTPESREAWLDRATRLAEEDLGQRVAMAPDAPAPVPSLVPAAPSERPSERIDGAMRGETLALAPQSAGGGALGLPAAVPAQARAGGAVVPSAPMAVMGGAMVVADAAPGAGGGVAGVDSYGATAGGALGKAGQEVARAGGQLDRQQLVSIKSFQQGWVKRPPADANKPQSVGPPTPFTARALVEVMPHPMPPAPEPPMVVGKPVRPFDTETYDKIEDNPFLDVTQNPLSTFSIDVDTGSYANVRRFLRAGQLPPAGAVRIEEMLNYFEYDYPPAPEGKPFSVSVDVVEAPWNAKHQLARIGLKGREIDPANRPPCNLVFLLDVSGSMNQPNKLPLVKQAMKILLEQLGEKDRVAIVTYAGASGLALPSTPADRKRDIREAIDELRPGGSTNGEAGIQLAYDIAKANLIPGGANRVILATDGDFNIGVTSRDELLRLIEDKAKSNVFLTVLGFGMGNLKDATLEQLADKGNGTYGYIDDEREAKRLFARHATGSLVTIAKDVKIQVEFNPARVGAYRLIGYENRALRAEDFNDDKKDAGEIGSGHTVTALYELVPPGEAMDLPKVDDLKYQRPAKAAPAAKSDEIMTVKLRYKRPDGDTSDKIEVPVKGEPGAIADAGADLKFAAAVAEFGMLLRHSPHKGSADWRGVLELAAAGRGADGHGDRAEFIDLVRAAEKLSDQR